MTARPPVRALLALTALLGLLLGGGVALASPAAAATVTTTLRAGIAGLPVATEVRTGYTREQFRHWIDDDGDGCSTRNEVLIAEATTRPAVGSGCALSGGSWYSYYDAVSWTAPADLDIDHLVPLAEAWDSGARTWTAPNARPTPTTSATPAPSSPSPTTSTRPKATPTPPSGSPATPAAGTSPNGSP